MRKLIALFIFALIQGTPALYTLQAQTLTQEFINAGYTLTELGSINDLPAQYGGLTIRPEEPDRLYIGGNANQASGAIYAVALLRDPVTHHITGFGGDAGLYVNAPNNDGGLFFAPNGTLLFTRYSMNELGQILPDDSYVSTPLNGLGIASSVGSIIFVPPGYPGAGSLIIASYNGGILYQVPFTIDGSGQYILSNQVAEVSVQATASGPEGVAYIPAGSAAFPHLSMVISSYGSGKVVVYEVGANGLPDVATARDLVVGLTGAEGAWIDPVTGDFLFSTFGGGNKVIRISGFEAPSAIGDNPAGVRAGYTVYPNPAEGLVNVDFTEKSAQGSIEVFNLLGERILYRDHTGEGQYQFNLSAWPDGVYIFRVQDGTTVSARRIVKF